MPKKKKILIVVDAPGPAEFIETVIPLLKKKAKVLVVTVNTCTNAPYAILRKFDPMRADYEEDAKKIYELFLPDTLAVATSSLLLGPFVSNAFTKLAHENGARIICFQDFWANHRWPMNWKMMKYWKQILAPDELAKKFLLEDGFEGKITVTGNPNFDKFASLDQAKDRAWLRKKFGLKDKDFLILYVGRGTPQAWKYDEITFKLFTEGVKKLSAKIKDKNIKVAVRPHPRDESPKRYKKLSSGLELIETFPFPSTEDMLPAADLVAGMMSTNHIESCYLRIPAACFMLPNAGQITLNKISLADFPPNLVGASIGIYRNSANKWRDTLAKIIEDEKFRAEMEAAQKKYFPIPKTSAAKKVAEALL